MDLTTLHHHKSKFKHTYVHMRCICVQHACAAGILRGASHSRGFLGAESPEAPTHSQWEGTFGTYTAKLCVSRNVFLHAIVMAHDLHEHETI